MPCLSWRLFRFPEEESNAFGGDPRLGTVEVVGTGPLAFGNLELKIASVSNTAPITSGSVRQVFLACAATCRDWVDYVLHRDAYALLSVTLVT